jgi:TRAP-type C4-dicarboxylate transport system substrate-binding protein
VGSSPKDNGGPLAAGIVSGFGSYLFFEKSKPGKPVKMELSRVCAFRLPVAAAFLCAALASGFRACQAQDVQLRLEHFAPESSPQHREVFLPWARRIEEASKGRIRVKVTGGLGVNGPPSELLGKVIRSETDISWTLAGYTPGRFQKLSVFELPWIVSSRAAVTSLALHEFYETHARDELADVHTLAIWCHSGGIIMSKERQVLLPSDLKGLRIRAASTQLGRMLSAFGAEPKYLPGTAVAAELDQGTLDGTLLPYEVIPTYQLQNRIHQISEFAGDRGLFTNIHLLAMSRERYMRLPPDLRQVIDENSGLNLAGEIGRLFDSFETAGRDIFGANGGAVTFIKGEQYDVWYRQSQPVIDAWVRQQKERGADGEGLLKAAKDLITKYSDRWAPLRN